MLGVIDEKHSVVEVVFLTKLLQELFRQCRCSRGKQPNVQKFVRLWIDSSVQPELLAVDSDHRFIERNVIRTHVSGGL
ncbi:hypothetical protein A6E15_18300 [Natrinema saccharevitans]|uniref:Uncharacterized protein n=1 Tax=Natrinema saccharevitans TaxID=301967 RepID=A0A1S8AS24_9EURY|nr:hypothetical protein A6E15_18300 [Natrinema saccharevitans]